MAIRMYIEHAVIISTLVTHNRVEFDLGKSALQLLEDHTRLMKAFFTETARIRLVRRRLIFM